MTRETGKLPRDLNSFYSHISRLYNSSISVFTAILFGWVTFNIFIINIINNKTSTLSRCHLWLIFITGLIIIGGSALYFYTRILRLGRFISKIENDLGLRNYFTDLPKITIYGRTLSVQLENAINRPNRDPLRWNNIGIT